MAFRSHRTARLRLRRLAVAILVTGAASSGLATSSAAQAASPTAPGTYVANRVYDTHKKQWIDFETLVARANQSDVVFVGEQHDNAPGHAMELALLQGIARRRITPVVLSLEMFERDVQSELDAYLAGTTDEAAFLKTSRPWPNYTNDYRPLVEFAKQQHWPVIAANIPRPLAAVVSHGGLGALDTLNKTVRREQIAADISCPHDAYFKLFSEAMDAGGHGAEPVAQSTNADSVKAAAVAAREMTQRFYEAQCVKDETMGESIAHALDSARAAGSGALVVQMNGSFHTDYTLGTAQRALKRAKSAKHMVISIVPVPDLDNVNTNSMRKRADYLVFTLGKAED